MQYPPRGTNAMIKDIVLPLTGTTGDANAVAAACELATAEGAHLALLELANLPVPVPGPWGMVPDASMASLYDELRAQSEQRAGKWREKLKASGTMGEVRVVESLFVEPPRTAAINARYADMSIITGAPVGDRDSAAMIHPYFSELLMESGGPVLVVPPSSQPTFAPRHAVVAWRPTPEASRALHDALPLLCRAATVDVVVVDPRSGESGDGEQPGADIATHLARHGLRVNVVELERGSRSVAQVLLSHARDTGADLLVAGGYGHSRFREWALGGATREMLEQSHLPVLFSH